MKSLFPQHEEHKSKKVICLGLTFETEEERRAYFTDELKKKLPELRKLEGFPLGSDEDILALSDPPYYTACPNPFVSSIISEWEQSKKNNDIEYSRQPFTADVSEGKNDPVYNVHTYHTKVPHKAIIRYILHYTKEGDIVYDGFAGTGMTGVAGDLCGDDGELNSMNIQPNGSIGGNRKVALGDLSPQASLISYVLSSKLDIGRFENEAKSIIQTVARELDWMYQTFHDEKEQKIGRINYVVWSDVFICSSCQNELVFSEVAMDEVTGKVKSEFSCGHCSVNHSKRSLNRVWETVFDGDLQETIKRAKQVPVIINYTYRKARYNKTPDEFDLLRIAEIADMSIGGWYPVDELPDGYNTRQPINSHGLSHVHHFYTRRTLCILSKIYELISRSEYRLPLTILFTSQLVNLSKLNRYRPEVSFPYNPLNGTLYVGSLVSEANVFDAYNNKIKRFRKGFKCSGGNVASSCNSLTDCRMVPDNSIDYVFTDPPFGGNRMYSELSYLWEAWLLVKTNNEHEAIVNSVQEKRLGEYQTLMERCFETYFRVLKPGRWMTVVFSNSQARVWNSIQEAIQRSGFVIANVSVLDKKQGSFKAVTTTTAVKQDLVISAYKPSTSMIEEIRTKENTEESAWVFVRSHLEKLPVFVGTKGEAELIVERTPRVLFDRMVAYHVQNGYSVPISSAEFQEGVAQRFPMRDGMAFLETQVTEYDKKRLLAKEFVQTILFVSDENSAIEWLRQQLMQKPQTRQDLHPNFMKELQHISKHELLPELDVLLEQNFLMYDGTDLVPSQIHGYLSTDFKDLRNLEKDDPKLQAKAKNRWYVPDPNKQADLEKLRERSLLREFNSYIEELGKSKKKLRQFRTEAIRAGFKTAWGNQDYQTIVDVGQRLPEKVLQEDSTMLMYYDNAQVRLGM